MKRSWFGLCLLLALLAGSLAVTWAMDRMHAPVAADLKQAAQAALAGDWDQADRLCLSAAEYWESRNRIRGCLADHGPQEAVDASLAAVEVYRTARERVAFAAACADAARQVEAMGEAHGLYWWNVLAFLPFSG